MTHKHTARYPHMCTHTHIHPIAHTFTRSDTPARVICPGRGAASVGVKRWTAFEPATSVTHPYWWQAEHTHTHTHSASASIAWPQGLEASMGGGGGGGWMNRGIGSSVWVKNIAGQVYLSRCDGGITETVKKSSYSSSSGDAESQDINMQTDLNCVLCLWD